MVSALNILSLKNSFLSKSQGIYSPNLTLSPVLFGRFGNRELFQRGRINHILVLCVPESLSASKS